MAFDFNPIGTLKRDNGDEEKNSSGLIILYAIHILHLYVYVRDGVTSHNLSYKRQIIKCDEKQHLRICYYK